MRIYNFLIKYNYNKGQALALYHRKYFNQRMLVVKCVLLLFCHHQLLGGVAMSKFTPTVHPITSSFQCGQYDTQQDELLMETLQQVKNHIQVHSSCESIYKANPSAASGYHQIQAINGSLVQVYCDMEGANCGGEGGWTRVAFVNMTKPGATCPQGLEQKMFDGALYCGRFSSQSSGCVSAVADNIISYRHVCGRVLGYQERSPSAFFFFGHSIDQVFFDGLSIMRGNPRKHIWTYTAGFDVAAISDAANCPCNVGNTNQTPSYVGNDYYCESGSTTTNSSCSNTFHSNDVLWDRKQCSNTEAPCCIHSNMPWFTKALKETTIDSIELRACQANIECAGSVAVFLIELYVR